MNLFRSFVLYVLISSRCCLSSICLCMICPCYVCVWFMCFVGVNDCLRCVCNDLLNELVMCVNGVYVCLDIVRCCMFVVHCTWFYDWFPLRMHVMICVCVCMCLYVWIVYDLHVLCMTYV